MAIQPTDLLVAYRPGNQTHYLLEISKFPTDLPNGTAEGDYLRWDGAAWVPSQVIDGGEYATE